MFPIKQLLQEIKRHTDSNRGQSPSLASTPITLGEIAKVESDLGFEWPPLLKSIYAEIGNGGFGPARGFLPVCFDNDPEVMDLLRIFHDCRRQPGWPAHLLPVIYCGCNVFFCIDCDHSNHRVIMYDGDLRDLEDADVGEPQSCWPFPESSIGVCFRTRADSFVEFIGMWLADETRLYLWS